MAKKTNQPEIVENEVLENVNTSVEVEELAENPLDRFFDMESVIEGLELALNTRKNIVLYGPGGHGKSEVVMAFLAQYGITPFVKVLGKGTSIDDLFGGIDLAKYTKEGVIEYLTENSFMEHEFVVFEEMMDCQPEILEMLKDVLTARKLRNGNQIVPLKTQVIFCCTNQERKNYAKNPSIKALMERFPLEKKVSWSSYMATSYDQLFMKRYKESNTTLAFICAEITKKREGEAISPRIALTAFDIVKATGKFGPLEFVADFKENINIVKEAMKKFEQLEEIKRFKDVFVSFANEIKTVGKYTAEDIDKIEEVKAIEEKLAKLQKDMSSYKAHDDVVTEYNNIFKEVKTAYSLMSSLRNTMIQLQENMESASEMLNQVKDFE